MKVRELIEELLKQDLDATVVVSGYEGGYTTMSTLASIDVALDYNTEDYYGPHQLVYNSEDGQEMMDAGYEVAEVLHIF